MHTSLLAAACHIHHFPLHSDSHLVTTTLPITYVLTLRLAKRLAFTWWVAIPRKETGKKGSCHICDVSFDHFPQSQCLAVATSFCGRLKPPMSNNILLRPHPQHRGPMPRTANSNQYTWHKACKHAQPHGRRPHMVVMLPLGVMLQPVTDTALLQVNAYMQ